MQIRVATPKPFLRRKTWFIRVQVPKEMQDSVGRKEFCRSLKTTSHREAIPRAPDVTAEIRTEIENLYHRSQQTRRTITRLTDREYCALLHKAYEAFAEPPEILKILIDYSGMTNASLATYEDVLEASIQDMVSKAEPPQKVKDTICRLQDEYNICITPGSDADLQMRSLCLTAYANAKRFQLAAARAYPLHDRADPRLKSGSN